MALPRSRVTPVEDMPRSQTPVVSPPHRQSRVRDCCLPHRSTASAFHPLARALILTDHDYTYFGALSHGLPSRYLRLRTPHRLPRTRFRDFPAG
jgi:hypothetical protein